MADPEIPNTEKRQGFVLGLQVGLSCLVIVVVGIGFWLAFDVGATLKKQYAAEGMRRLPLLTEFALVNRLPMVLIGLGAIVGTIACLWQFRGKTPALIVQAAIALVLLAWVWAIAAGLVLPIQLTDYLHE